jgi:hypothetical protein
MENIDFNSLYVKASEAEAKVEKLAAQLEAAQSSEQATFAETLDKVDNDGTGPSFFANASLVEAFPDLAVFNFKGKIDALSNLSSILTGSQSSKPDHSASIQQPLKKPGAKIYTQADANKKLNKHPDDGGLVPKKSKLSRLGGPIADVFPGSEGSKEPSDTNQPSVSYGVHTPGSVSEAQENEAGTAIVITTQGDVCSEPASSFAPVYPLNKVSESESGHFRELDDTPGAERIKESHRSGSYYEIHPDGSKTTKIVRDNFEVVIGSDYTKIKGTCAVHIEQDAELFCHGDVNMMAMGQLDAFALTTASVTALGQASVVGLGEAVLASLGKAAVTSVGKSSVFSAGTTEIVGMGSVDMVSAGVTNIVSGPGGINLATDGVMTFSDSFESQTLLGLATGMVLTGMGAGGLVKAAGGVQTGVAGKAIASAAKAKIIAPG